jgi:dienelactone hydrolase
MTAWVCGQAQDGKAIIFNYDIYGLNSGRSKAVAEELAAAGYLVVMPDYFRGRTADTEDWKGLAIDHANWKAMADDFKTTLDYILANGGQAGHIGTIGFCWGTWPVVKQSSYPEIAGGAHCHPSHPGIVNFNKDGETEAKVIEAITCPQLLLPSKQEGPTVRPGGLADTTFASKPFAGQCKIVEFDTMSHGWVSRGDLSDPAIAKGYADAMTEIKAFFAAVL